MDRPKEIGSLGQILQGKLEEQLFPRLPLPHLLKDGVVVKVGIFDGVVKYRGVRGEPRHRKFGDIMAESPLCQEPTGNVVEPKALTEIMQLLCRFHGSSCCALSAFAAPSKAGKS